MTDTAFAWTVAGIGSVLVLLILWVANRRRTDEPMWSPWDERLIAKGICPAHTPAKLGSEDCDSDCPPPREVVDAEMDALDDHIHHGTPDPALRAAEIAELGKVEPEVRYWVTRPSIGWHEHEVTRWEYVYLELEFDFRTEAGTDPATRWFCEPHVISAWTTRDGDRGDAPISFAHPRDCRAAWADPNAEVTAPVEHASPRDRLRRIAAAHEQHLGVRPVAHAQARAYRSEGIEAVCSGCGDPWPCDGARAAGLINGSAS